MGDVVFGVVVCFCGGFDEFGGSHLAYHVGYGGVLAGGLAVLGLDEFGDGGKEFFEGTFAVACKGVASGFDYEGVVLEGGGGSGVAIYALLEEFFVLCYGVFGACRVVVGETL